MGSDPNDDLFYTYIRTDVEPEGDGPLFYRFNSWFIWVNTNKGKLT